MFYPYERYRSVTPLDAARVNRTIFHNHSAPWYYITLIKGGDYIKYGIIIRHGKQNPHARSRFYCKEQGRMFVWSFQVWQFRVVSGYRRNMGYLRLDCRAGVFALWDTLPCPYPVGDSSLSLPCGRPIIKIWKPSARGLPGSRAGCTGLTNIMCSIPGICEPVSMTMLSWVLSCT